MSLWIKTANMLADLNQLGKETKNNHPARKIQHSHLLEYTYSGAFVYFFLSVVSRAIWDGKTACEVSLQVQKK